MKVKVNIRDLLAENADHNDLLLFHSGVEIDDLLDTNGIEAEREFDVHDLLAEQKAIGLVFAIADVKKLRPDLTDEQAWEVLQRFEAAAQDCPDPMWETVCQLADAHFPRKRRARPTQVAKIVADYDPHGDERENLVDLLTDAYHWCEELGEPLEEFLATAKMHFNEENQKGERA